jgi:chaperone modulatory protein CbpM
METHEFLLLTRLDDDSLAAWVAAGWLVHSGEERGFSEVDVARANLIHNLRTLGVNDEAVPIVLDLIDQVHGLRRVLRECLARIGQQSGSAAG